MNKFLDYKINISFIEDGDGIDYDLDMKLERI